MEKGHVHPSNFDFKERLNTGVVACRKVIDGALRRDREGDE